MTRHLALTLAILTGGCVGGGGGGGDDGSTGDDTTGDDTTGDDGGGDDQPPTGITPQEFIEQLIASDCTKAFACEAEFPTSEGTFADEWGDSESECLTDDDDYLSRNAIAVAVQAGKILFDSSSASTCLADLQYPATCAAFFTTYDWPDACYDALIGTVADGGTCTVWWECSGDDSECTGGVCAPATDDGE